MSSTNRGAERPPHDFFSTPAWVTQAILPYLDTSGGALDPCCGDGAILAEIKPTRKQLSLLVGAGMLGIEIDGERAQEAMAKGYRVTLADALIAKWPASPLVITNPPFSLALDFVCRAIEHARQNGGTAALLLRLAFLESKVRAPFHAASPSDVYAFAHRPSFTGDGKSDSCAYAWFVWDMRAEAVADRLKNGGRVRVLPDEPPARPRLPRANKPKVIVPENGHGVADGFGGSDFP